MKMKLTDYPVILSAMVSIILFRKSTADEGDGVDAWPSDPAVIREFLVDFYPMGDYNNPDDDLESWAYLERFFAENPPFSDSCAGDFTADCWAENFEIWAFDWCTRGCYAYGEAFAKIRVDR